MKRFNPTLTEEEKALALKVEEEWKENPKLLPIMHLGSGFWIYVDKIPTWAYSHFPASSLCQ